MKKEENITLIELFTISLLFFCVVYSIYSLIISFVKDDEIDLLNEKVIRIEKMLYDIKDDGSIVETCVEVIDGNFNFVPCEEELSYKELKERFIKMEQYLNIKYKKEKNTIEPGKYINK